MKRIILPGLLIFLNMAVVFAPTEGYKTIAFYILFGSQLLVAVLIHILIEGVNGNEKCKSLLSDDNDDIDITFINPRIYIVLNCFLLLVNSARLIVMRTGSPMWKNHCLILGIGIILALHYKVKTEDIDWNKT